MALNVAMLILLSPDKVNYLEYTQQLLGLFCNDIWRAN